MGNGYVVPAVDSMDEIRLVLRGILERLNELEAPDGSQIYSTVQTLKQLVEGLLEQTEVNVSGGVTAGGAGVFGGDITSTGGTLWSLYAYNNPVVTSYLAAYINNDGRFGATPSALRFKQDVSPRVYTLEDVMLFQIVNYRLIESVKLNGELAAHEVGVIGDWLLEAGFPEFVVTNPSTGEVITVHYERLALVAIGALQEVKGRLDGLDARLEAAGI